MSILCSMVGASFTVAVTVQVLRAKKVITAVGNAQVSTAQSKFGGASSLYDGNGDYLTIPNSSDFNFTGDYTIEGWWYQPSNVAAGIYPTLIGTGAVSDNKGWAVTSEPTTNKVLFITSGDGSSGMQVLLTSASLSAATWNHWAVVRNNSVLTVYINGTASGSTYTTTGNSIASTYPLYIGGGVGGLSSGNFSSSSATVVNLNGYQDEIRLSNSARYTSGFTPSTTPFIDDTNTLLLMHTNGTNASTVFEDDNGINRSQVGISAIGNAQISTAQSKFGGSSFLSDGAGDYLQIAPNSEFAFTGDFTVECFLRFSAHEQYGGIFSCANPGSTQSQGYQVIFNDTANTLNAYIDSGTLTGSTTLSTNTWHHIALVRSSGVFTLYINGTSNGTLSNSATMSTSTYNFYWGTERTAGQEVTGNFDEMRVSNTARYTAAFTPSTAAFVNDANTVLLIHADGTNGSTVFTDDNAQLTITPAATSVNEGSSLTFNVSTLSTADQTLYYSLTNAGDFATSTGSFSLTSNAGSFSVTPTADTTTEGAETFTASVRTGSTSGPIIATTPAVTINDTSTTAIVVNSAFTDDSSTKILLHFENNVVDDNSSGRTAVATQTLYDTGAFRTDQKKFGSYSVGGTGIPGGWSTNNPTALNPGTGDFTIEFWFRPCATGNSDQITMRSQSTGSVHIFLESDGGFIGFGKQNISWDVQATVGAISVAWHHFAVTRSGTTLRLYLDGTVRNTVTGNTDNYTSNVWSFSMGGASGTYFYMDEFRISSIARYTSNFTVA